MPDYRRNRTPGGTYFFTVNLLDRKQNLLVEHVDALRAAVRKVRTRHPFHIDAWVVLPEHMHAIWTLPAGDSDYSTRWNAIKVLFTNTIPKIESVIELRAAKGGAASGNGGSGSTRSATRPTTARISITFISTR